MSTVANNQAPAPDFESVQPDIVRQLESDHVVTLAPYFAEQAQDETRTNKFTFLAKQTLSISDTSGGIFNKYRQVTNEHSALRELQTYLVDAAVNPRYDREIRDQARSLADRLTFLGQQEYQESAQGLATYWKSLLAERPDRSLHVITGKISELDHIKGGNGQPPAKSDVYTCDAILSHFSDQELQHHAGRLHVGTPPSPAIVGQHDKVIVLDDWMISGKQIAGVLRTLPPELLDQTEINLLAAPGDVLRNGMQLWSTNGTQKITVPARAYYLAHRATKTEHDTHSLHISGTHSSGDYNFANMLSDMTRLKRGASLPPLATVVRPYRMSGFTTEHTDRLLAAKRGNTSSK